MIDKNVFSVRCRGEEYPLNIINDVYFTWQLKDCTAQKKYTLVIYKGTKEIYKKSATTSEQICYADKLELEPLTLYKYTVTVETDVFTETSAEHRFYSGLVNGFDKSAKWISDGSCYAADSDVIGSPARYLRKTFTVDNKPKMALVNICGLGFYELYINGKRIGNRVLEPGFTEYEKRVLYSTYDVLSELQQGENLIEVTLGDGWYNQASTDTWGFFRAPWRDTPKLLFQLNVGKNVVVSDTSWEYSYGEITMNALRVGENCNFNKTREYKKAKITTPPGGKLEPSYLPPIRECEVLTPVAEIKGKGCTIYDFGKNIAGYCGIYFKGKRNKKVEITYSDRIKDGKCDNASNSMYIYNPNLKYQTDECTLSGKTDYYKPHFVYHGFRYVTISKGVKVEDIKAYFVRTDLKQIGSFKCSTKEINALFDMSINAIKSNYHSMPTDCPHREKNGWTGDAQLSLETCIQNFDMQEAYRKWLDDFLVNQRPSGQISCIIPTGGWGFNWGSGTTWDVAFFRITKALYEQYGDIQTLRKVYPALKKYHDYISGYLQDGLMDIGLSDWNYPKNIKFEVCPGELTSSANFKYMSETLGDFATVLEPEKAEYYYKHAKSISKALAEKYKEEKSLTGLACLTYFGILNKAKEVCSYLENNGCELHAGILGTKYTLQVLTNTGRSDLAYKLLTKTTYPSFGYWAVNGQTTLCEDFELTNSLNHHMYSPIAEYMQKNFAGLTFGKGMCNATLNPTLPKEMDKAELTVDSRYGAYTIYVERVDGKIRVDFSVPVGCKVTLKNKVYKAGDYTVTL